MNEHTNPIIGDITKQLVEDINLLERAFLFTTKESHEYINVNSINRTSLFIYLDYSLWVYIEFDGNANKYHEFITKEINENGINNIALFDFFGRSKDYTNEKSERILNRIDLALHFIKKDLGIGLPSVLKDSFGGLYSIRLGLNEQQDKVLYGAKSFAMAAQDLFVKT